MTPLQLAFDFRPVPVMNASSKGHGRPVALVTGSSRGIRPATDAAEATAKMRGPGMVSTDSARLWADTSHPGGWEAFTAERAPEGIIAPEHIAEVIAFLCTPAGRCIRGHDLIVDAGLTLPFA